MRLRLAGLSRRDGFDAVLAVLLTAMNYSLLAGPAVPATATDAWILSTIHSAPVAARRRAPRAAFAISTAAGLLYLVRGHDMIGLGIAVLVMVYSLAAEVPRRQSLTGLAAIVVPFLAIAVTVTDLEPTTIVVDAMALAVAWFLGDSARVRREQALLELHSRAARAVADERLRIARELHDVVAHSMSVVTVQAGMARVVLDDDPDTARRSLVAIERAGQQAMEEMRRLLQVLREDRPPTDPAALDPTPGLGDLDGLVADTTAAGTAVALDVIGDRRDLAPGVELAAYRVVQEAITNVRKHAPGSSARVRVEYGERDLVVAIDSELVDGAVPGPVGHGLTGMRERVELYRGRLEAGASPDRRFRVTARIPYDEEKA